MDSVLFTPAAVLDMLTQIEELKDVDLSMVETLDGQIQLQVGESYYNIEPEQETEIAVSEQAIDDVEDANMAAYENLDENEVSVETPEGETIESGLIKEAAKALLLGGVIKMIPGLISNK